MEQERELKWISSATQPEEAAEKDTPTHKDS